VNIGGHVNLTGTVPSYPQYMQAAAADRRVAGVITLEVVLPERDRRDDVKLATAANNALATNVTVPESVEALAGDGIITLTGHVRTWAEHDAVLVAALMARGVIDVCDDLQVTG
jgi:osmotically-inducible protein OsmY